MAPCMPPPAAHSWVPSDLAATYTVVARPFGPFSRSACPASTLSHGLALRRVAHPLVYDVPHAHIVMDGVPCGRPGGLLRAGRNMTLVAAPALTTAAAAAAAGATDVWAAVRGRPSMAAMLHYTGDPRDVWVGWERHNRKCGRGHSYRRCSLFIFIASAGRRLQGVGLTFARAQPFVVTFNPAVCVLGAPIRAGA